VRCVELVEVGRLFGPANEVALFEVKRHTLDPLADSLELIAAVIGEAAFRLDHIDRDRVTFGVQKDSLAGRVRVVDIKLDNKATLDTRGDQLLSLFNEDAFRDQSQIQRHLFYAVKVLVEDKYFEVFRACKVEMVLLTVADAGDLAASLTETFGFRKVLRVTELESGFENGFACLWVPDVDPFLVVRAEATMVIVLTIC